MSSPTLDEELQRWLRQLQDPAPQRRMEAAANIGSFGVLGRPAVNGLCTALHDSDLLVRKLAAEALVQLGGGADGLVCAVASLLKDSDGRRSPEGGGNPRRNRHAVPGGCAATRRGTGGF